LAALLTVLIGTALIRVTFFAFLLLLAAFAIRIAHLLAIAATWLLLVCHSASFLTNCL
jgi:hypothetical protein